VNIERPKIAKVEVRAKVEIAVPRLNERWRRKIERYCSADCCAHGSVVCQRWRRHESRDIRDGDCFTDAFGIVYHHLGLGLI
jgi:hypothetical protein